MLDDNADRPISDAYTVIDTDLARDNIENDLPDAERRDLVGEKHQWQKQNIN